MSSWGAPRPPGSPLGRLRSATDASAMEAMRRRAWREHGVATIAVGEIGDDWLRQAITNEAVRRWGPRWGGQDG